MPTVSFATACWERDWRKILLTSDYLSELMIGHHQFGFGEKLLVINNVNNLDEVAAAAQKKIDEGVLTRYIIASDVADQAFKQIDLRPDDLVSTDPSIPSSWLYYNALAPLAAIFAARGEFLLYHTGDVFMKKPVSWIEQALLLMQDNPLYKVANLTWNDRLDEVAKESIGYRKRFYVSDSGFSDQQFLIRRSDFLSSIYREIRPDASHYPRGDVFEKRIFCAMKNRGWLRLTYAKGSYTHENI